MDDEWSNHIKDGFQAATPMNPSIPSTISPNLFAGTNII
jgi:hypothetical protein